jgi:hypothetical protein
MPIAKQASQLGIEDLTLSVKEEIHVRASIETTFRALLEQLGPLNEVPESGPMPMKLEAWPEFARRKENPDVPRMHFNDGFVAGWICIA